MTASSSPALTAYVCPPYPPVSGVALAAKSLMERSSRIRRTNRLEVDVAATSTVEDVDRKERVDGVVDRTGGPVLRCHLAHAPALPHDRAAGAGPGRSERPAVLRAGAAVAAAANPPAPGPR